jgi:hypothetical protein
LQRFSFSGHFAQNNILEKQVYWIIWLYIFFGQMFPIPYVRTPQWCSFKFNMILIYLNLQFLWVLFLMEQNNIRYLISMVPSSPVIGRRDACFIISSSIKYYISMYESLYNDTVQIVFQIRRPSVSFLKHMVSF